MRERIRRRMFPLIASVGLVLVGMFTTTWGPTLIGRSEWALPYDLWGTLIATTRLAHGNVGGLYAPPTGLISLPGAAVILLPCAALIAAFHLSLAIPGPDNLHPAVWLLAGPYQIAIGCLPLFAADALAERLGVPRWTRGLLALAGARRPVDGLRPLGAPRGRGRGRAAALRGAGAGHGRTALAGWLAGAAVCVQPLVLLALPIMLALLPWRRMPAVPGPGRPAVGGAARRGRDRQLARHVPVGDQPAGLPGHQPPDDLDVAGPAHGQPERRGGPVPAGHDRARLPVRARHPPPLGRARPRRPRSGSGGRRSAAGRACSGGSRSRWRCGRSSSR